MVSEICVGLSHGHLQNVTLYAVVKELELEDALALVLTPAVRFIYLLAHVARPVRKMVSIPSAVTLTAVSYVFLFSFSLYTSFLFHLPNSERLS